MSAIEKARKVVEKQRSVGFATESKRVRTPPRFASHTQSSLMKMRTPINLRKKLSSAVKDKESRSGIFKRRSELRRRSRSVLALKMILDQRHHATCRSLSGDVLTTRPLKSKRYTDNLLVSLQDDLIKDISWSIIKCARSPIKLASKIVGRSEARAEDSNDSLDVTCSLSFSSVSVREELDSNSVCESSENATIVSRSDVENIEKESVRSPGDDVNVSKQIDAFKHEDNEPRTLPEEASSSTSQTDEIKVLHRRSRHRRLRETESSNENNIETQVCQRTAINRKYTRRIWKKRRAKKEETEFNAENAGSQNSANSKSEKQIDNSQDTRANSDAKFARKKNGQKNFNIGNRRAWRPAGIGKYSNAENTASSTQLASQKSSRLTEKPVAPTKDKHSSVEQVESFDSGSTSASMSSSQSKVLKENRDPGREAKEQHDQQKKGVQKRKRWTRKIPNDSGKDNEVGSRWHWRSFTPRSPKDSNDNEQNFSESVKDGRLTVRELLNMRRNDKDARENVASDTDVFRKNDGETPPSRDAEMPIDNLATTGDSNKAETPSREQSSCMSIGTQTESNSLTSEQISKETRTVASQTSPCDKTEIGCNTTSYICQDAEVSCDLIGSSNVRPPVAIEKASTSENNEIHVTNIYDSDNVYDITIVDPDSPYESSNAANSEIRNEVEREETENVLSDDLIETMRTIFELAAERARNLHEAVVIYYENLMSRDDGRNEEIRYDEEPSRDHHYRLERYASFTSSASIEEIGDSDGERPVASDDDFDKLSTRSSSSTSSGQTFVSVIRNSRANVAEQIVDRDEENARSSLNESLDGSKSLMRVMVCRAQEKHALEILRSENDEEKEIKILTLPEAEIPSILARDNLLPLVCCALCTVVVWCLQFLFQCHSDA